MIRFLLHIINHELNSRVFSSMHKFRLTTQICTIILPGICTEEGGGTNYMESLSISSLIYVQKMEKSVLFFHWKNISCFFVESSIFLCKNALQSPFTIGHAFYHLVLLSWCMTKNSIKISSKQYWWMDREPFLNSQKIKRKIIIRRLLYQI